MSYRVRWGHDHNFNWFQLYSVGGLEHSGALWSTLKPSARGGESWHYVGWGQKCQRDIMSRLLSSSWQFRTSFTYLFIGQSHALDHFFITSWSTYYNSFLKGNVSRDGGIHMCLQSSTRDPPDRVMWHAEPKLSQVMTVFSQGILQTG